MYSLLFSAPTIFFVMAISALMSLIASLLGAKEQSISLEGNLFYVLMLHALAPAIFEEMLFRYIPVRFMGAESPKLCVVYSSLLFALSHCNLFQIPHAIFAGLVFSSITLISGNIFPSIVIHFLNNLASVIWQRSEKNDLFVWLFFGILITLTLISIAIILLKRKKYYEEFFVIFEDKSKVKFTLPFAVYAGATLLFGIFSMFL